MVRPNTYSVDFLDKVKHDEQEYSWTMLSLRPEGLPGLTLWMQQDQGIRSSSRA